MQVIKKKKKLFKFRKMFFNDQVKIKYLLNIFISLLFYLFKVASF